MSGISGFVCIALTLSATVLAAPAKKHIQVKVCKRSDPLFVDCVKNELQSAIPQLSDGYAKYRIPAIDPFELPALDIAKGNGAVAVDLSLQNLKIYGLSSAQITSLILDVDNLKASARFTFTKSISMVGQYTAKGKVQVLPINGKGPCNITLVDPVLELTDIEGEVVERNGQKYINLKGVTLKAAQMGKLTLRLDNLFQGNKELSDNLNSFLNENWQLLFAEMKPAFEEALGIILREIVNKILQKIPKDDLFPL